MEVLRDPNIGLKSTVRLSMTQFFSNGFQERKIQFLMEAIKSVRRWDNEANKRTNKLFSYFQNMLKKTTSGIHDLTNNNLNLYSNCTDRKLNAAATAPLCQVTNNTLVTTRSPSNNLAEALARHDAIFQEAKAKLNSSVVTSGLSSTSSAGLVPNMTFYHTSPSLSQSQITNPKDSGSFHHLSPIEEGCPDTAFESLSDQDDDVKHVNLNEQ